MPQAEVLRGQLEYISLPSVLQLAEAETVTGWLTLDEAGRIGLNGGHLVSANKGLIAGMPALLDLFVESASSFSLVLDGSVHGQRMGSLIGIIMEGCRLADEWHRLAPQVLIRTANEAGGLEDHPDAQKVVALLNGSYSLYAAVAKAQVPRSHVIDPLLHLLEEGALREVTSPPPPPRESRPAPADYHTAMDEGRRLLRGGDFDGAEAAFERAIAVRPDDRVAQQNLRRVRQVRSGEAEKGFSRWFRRR